MVHFPSENTQPGSAESGSHAADSGCANPECSCVPYDGGSLSSERMPWQLAVDSDGWPMVHNIGDVICVPDPNHHAGCAWDIARFRLISAAPDLLEAAKALKAAFGDPMTRRALGGHSERQMEAILGASAAIRKATTAPETGAVGTQGEARSAPSNSHIQTDGEA